MFFLGLILSYFSLNTDLRDYVYYSKWCIFCHRIDNNYGTSNAEQKKKKTEIGNHTNFEETYSGGQLKISTVYQLKSYTVTDFDVSITVSTRFFNLDPFDTIWKQLRRNSCRHLKKLQM